MIKKGTRRAVVAMLAACWLLPCGLSAQDAPKMTTVRAAYVPVATWLPAWVALDKGIFAKHGLAVTLTPIQNLSLLPPIKTVADLKGKAIAAPTIGAVIHVATLYWLKKNGVDPASIRAVEVPFPNMGDQLKAGNVDAVEALEPFTGALLAAGNVSLGDPLLSVGDEVLFPFWISDGAWARANRPVIKAWIDSLTAAKADMDANPADARAVLAKYSRLPPAVVEKVPLPTYRFTIKPDELGVWIDVLKDLGQLSTAIDPSKIVVTAP